MIVDDYNAIRERLDTLKPSKPSSFELLGAPCEVKIVEIGVVRDLDQMKRAALQSIYD